MVDAPLFPLLDFDFDFLIFKLGLLGSSGPLNQVLMLNDAILIATRFNSFFRTFTLAELSIRLSAYNQLPLTYIFANTFPANIHNWPRAAPMSVSDWFDRTAQKTQRVISFN